MYANAGLVTYLNLLTKRFSFRHISMGFFDRLFGRGSLPEDLGDLTLNLQHPPTPGFAAQHSQIAVDAARNVSGIDLDYSPQSLNLVDRIILGFHFRRAYPQPNRRNGFHFWLLYRRGLCA